ncbi:MAG: tryptophan synthase subunit alpha [Gemmatimonadota bacterium]
MTDGPEGVASARAGEDPAERGSPEAGAPEGRGRLADTFAGLADGDGAAFVPFLTHGFPSPADTPRLLDRLAEAGADVIELGVPFSDPLADGPTIQRSSWRALERGVTLAGTLELVARRAADLPPIVLFTYLNPVLRMGVERFLERAEASGVAGVLVTDLPVGAHPELERALASAGPDLIALVAPTTPPARVERIVGRASGFLYYISRLGVTGARDRLDEGLARRVEALRRQMRLPVAVGFGISSPEHARAVARVADGVVVGSALIAALERGEDEFGALAAELAAAAHEPG